MKRLMTVMRAIPIIIITANNSINENPFLFNESCKYFPQVMRKRAEIQYIDLDILYTITTHNLPLHKILNIQLRILRIQKEHIK